MGRLALLVQTDMRLQQIPIGMHTETLRSLGRLRRFAGHTRSLDSCIKPRTPPHTEHISRLNICNDSGARILAPGSSLEPILPVS